MRGGGNVGRADGEIHHRQALGNPLGAHLGQLTEDTDAKGIHSVGKLQGIFTSYWVQISIHNPYFNTIWRREKRENR